CMVYYYGSSYVFDYW
nr:immunoglobulin heavy chain junction region [Mus musculus]MBK4195046.1 immunoglobulin heavy chain junction region [Mus musculus]